MHENVFASRNFRLVFFGALVSEFGAVFYSFAVSFYILEITDNNAFLQGFYLALCGFVLLLFTPIGGVLGDRFHKAKIMTICDYLKGGLILAATGAMILFPASNAHLIILFITGIIGNAISGVFSPAASALFPEIVSEQKLQQANSYFSIKSSLQGIFGVVLAGVMYASLSIYTLFFIVGLCYVFSGVSEMFIRYTFVPSKDKLTLNLMLGDMKDGLVYLKTRKAIMAFMAAVLFINFFFAPVSSNFLPYFVKTDIASAPSYLFEKFLSPELWSSVFSMLTGIGSLVAAVILSAKPQEDKCGRKVSFRLCAIAAMMIALTICYWILVELQISLNLFLIFLSAGFLAIGFIVVSINIPTSTVMMRIVDKDKLSKVSSILSIGSQGLIPIASVLAGIILQYAGSSSLLLISSIGFTATAIFMLLNKHISDL